MGLFSIETVRMYADSIGLGHLKEDTLSILCHDMEYRVREIVQESGKFMRHSNRQKLTVEDVNYALKHKHVEPIYGYDPSEMPVFESLPQDNVYYIQEKEIDFDSMLTTPLPSLPQPVSVTSHWLAIEGVQPKIPENPSHISQGDEPEILVLEDTMNREEEGDGKVIIKHHLSKEHQMYFNTIKSCLLSQDEKSITIALDSLKADAGIQQLLPYFVQFVSEMIMKHLRQLKMLRLLVKTIGALLTNTHLFIEPYLHQIMPALLTCIVGKRLCESVEEDHWELREEASDLVGSICKKYGDSYSTLQPRIMKTLMKALMDPKKDITSKYGAIACLSSLGTDAVELFIMPNIRTCYNIIQESNTKHLFEKNRCTDALTKAVGTLLKERIDDSTYAAKEYVSQIKEKYNEAIEILGERLDPYVGITKQEDDSG